jgi:hypothetical protein
VELALSSAGILDELIADRERCIPDRRIGAHRALLKELHETAEPNGSDAHRELLAVISTLGRAGFIGCDCFPIGYRTPPYKSIFEA